MKELSNEARLAFNLTDHERISVVSKKIEQYLMDNYGEMQTITLNDKELRAFEVCALTVEYSTLHLGKNQRFNFILLELIGQDERLAQLKQRIKLIDLPNQVAEIEQDWKSFLARSLEEMQVLKGMSSSLLNESQSDYFYKRVGIKVISQFKRMLAQINSQETFAPYLIKSLMQDYVIEVSMAPEILSMITQENAPDIVSDIFA